MPRASTSRAAAAALLVAVGGACAPASGTAAGGPAAATATARGCPTAPTVRAGAADAGGGQLRDPRAALGEICAMMVRSAAEWNRGDLDAFVTDYLPGEGTTFIGRRGVVRGPAAIRDVYAPRFGPGGVHDSLSFQDVEVDLLAPDVANTIAWYVLARGDSVVARGPTSLVMRRVEGRWRIVHDHSS